MSPHQIFPVSGKGSAPPHACIDRLTGADWRSQMTSQLFESSKISGCQRSYFGSR